MTTQRWSLRGVSGSTLGTTSKETASACGSGKRPGRRVTSAHDVASYILRKMGRMTTMKLQKLVYYSQAWSLVWDEEPLFLDRIEAWAAGPVVPALYERHRGEFKVSDWPWGNPERLSAPQIETIDSVLDYYGDKSSQWLSQLTHREDPWHSAREGLDPGERGNRVITHGVMAEYYGSL